ncbi:MAG TPA: hypothetical protein VHG51_17060 [Longimicrobiaceae bacterium]|nr:hypothetical protein [Longimicrobiaceae bacterium]
MRVEKQSWDVEGFGFRVELLDCDGSSARGNTRPGTVRDTCLDGDE